MAYHLTARFRPPLPLPLPLPLPEPPPLELVELEELPLVEAPPSDDSEPSLDDSSELSLLLALTTTLA